MSDITPFGINGRFLMQPMTGVQRYALNTTKAIGEILASQSKVVQIIASASANNPNIDGTLLKNVGRSTGHAWEQITLPSRWPDQLLNLCNTAPISKTNQTICIHDTNVFIAPESYSKSFRVCYKTLQPILARRAAKITTVSQFSARQIAHHLSLDISKLVILPNGHEHVFNWKSDKAISAPSALRRNPDGTLRPFVVALGSQAKHKNIKILFSILDDLSELGIDLVIVGGNLSIFNSESAQNFKNVIYLGYVTDHDIAYLFEKALCLAFPSITEGFGLPVLEAMASGCPVISSDRASLPEICGSAALLASPDNPQAWVKHIKSLIASNHLREDLIGRGYHQASLFSWDNTAQGYLVFMYCNFILSHSSVKSNLPKVVVVIATLGRPEVVTQTIRRILDQQLYQPEAVIVSCVDKEDAGTASNWPEVTVITSRPGLAAQRNAALAAIANDIEIVIFFDDDFVPEANWLSTAAHLFQADSEIVSFTGDVLVDGIKGPGLTFDDVDLIIAKSRPVMRNRLIESFSPYGCNMAFRRSAIGALKFDERLVLYGWLEDRDFGAALTAKRGRRVKSMAARGVHMGVKNGRMAGYRLGYSQIINPIYLLKKGTMTYWQVFDHVFRNFTSNFLRSIYPEPFIDRRGRLRGNLRALVDLFSGQVEPERVLQIKGKFVK